jgi:hypothetical protein
MAFVAEARVPEEAIERASLVAMMMTMGRELGRGELTRLIKDGNTLFAAQSAASGERDLLAMRKATLSLPFEGVVLALGDQGIDFSPEEQMRDAAWRAPDGGFSLSFQDACRMTFEKLDVSMLSDEEDGEVGDPADNGDWDGLSTLTAERRRLHLWGTSDQAYAVRTVAVSSREHYAITALAGTGKTHLMLALAGSDRKFTHLAPTKAHQYAFRERAGSNAVPSVLLWALANDMAAAHVRERSTRWLRPPTVRRSGQPASVQLQAARIVSIAGDDPFAVLANVQRSINRWCTSDDASIGLEHVVLSGHGSMVDRAAYLAAAERVWALMFAPLDAKTERPFNVRIFHMFKWLDVQGASLPPLGTLLVDEAHDLPAALHSLMRRYPDGCVVMGDPYQRLKGNMPRSASSRMLRMVQSVRAGGQAIPLIRTVLDLHSAPLVPDTIQGSRDRASRVRFYKVGAALPTEGFRVYGSIWSVLEDALRLRHAGIPFRLLPETERALTDAAEDAIGMRRGPSHARYYGNREFRTWNELASHLEEIGYRLVVRLFERDFGSADLALLRDMQASPGAAGLILGLLEHCKSLEFDTVTMWPCSFKELPGAENQRSRDERIRAVYLAMTRVCNELWLPGAWLELLTD